VRPTRYHQFAKKGKNDMKMRWLLVVVLVGIIINGPTWSNQIENRRVYGECVVQMEIDDFSDERDPNLTCVATGSGMGKYRVGAVCTDRITLIKLKAGIELNFRSTIRVVYRFGKEDVSDTEWTWETGEAVSSSTFHYDAIIDGIRREKKFVFQVGSESKNNKGVVYLAGGMLAVTDFESRCKDLGR
jgi:hypothetical protein